jgi:hypothetical protein
MERDDWQVLLSEDAFEEYMADVDRFDNDFDSFWQRSEPEDFFEVIRILDKMGLIDTEAVVDYFLETEEGL